MRNIRFSKKEETRGIIFEEKYPNTIMKREITPDGDWHLFKWVVDDEKNPMVNGHWEPINSLINDKVEYDIYKDI